MTIKFEASRDQETILSKTYGLVFSQEKTVIECTEIKYSQEIYIEQHNLKELS